MSKFRICGGFAPEVRTHRAGWSQSNYLLEPLRGIGRAITALQCVAYRLGPRTQDRKRLHDGLIP